MRYIEMVNKYFLIENDYDSQPYLLQGSIDSGLVKHLRIFAN